jgi:cytochrome c oxidase subunit 2
VTAADVIHNWAMPSFGVKMDAYPGRLNETWFKANKTFLFHSVIDSYLAQEFLFWAAGFGHLVARSLNSVIL